MSMKVATHILGDHVLSVTAHAIIVTTVTSLQIHLCC